MIVPKTRNRAVSRGLTPLVVLLAVVALPLAAARAQQIEPLPAELAQKIGELLVKAAADLDNLPVPFEGNPAQAVGVAVSEGRGIVLVPQKGLGEEQPPDMTAARGAGLALLFSSPEIVPMVDGKLIDRGKLYGMSVTDPEGNQHEANCMLLTVRKLSGEDYRLYVFGKADEPLIDTGFSLGKGPGAKPLAVEIKDVEGSTGAVVVTVFDKYQARFRGGVAD